MIELRQLCRDFLVGDQMVHALDHIDLHIAAGEYLSVMGPSGSGKSTLLNILGLLDKPSAGEYLLAGTATGSLREEQRAKLRRQHIGFVFQSYHLIPRLTARENIELPLVLAGEAPKTRRQKVDQLLERLDLSERAEHIPNQLSGGQRQRVAIGRAIITEPDLLLADEPT
ncbi:MAG TPA: macrolide ABC transporter ATP-binding protein, partial [Porticoccaceae bacterium]|nr:macrolide ABC transporter ATP-binding protein [Porticoccaceae bacterium]